MGIGACIDDGAIRFPAQGVNSVDDLPFSIVLQELQLDLQLGGHAAQRSLDVGERLATVDLRFANAEEIEVRPVDDRNLHRPPANKSSIEPWPATYPPSNATASGFSESLSGSDENNMSIDPTSAGTLAAPGEGASAMA